jgi:cellulose synthase/poly-beta-1,6-N-acetylglucosamine synthase-like glycosyltransferase
MVIDPDITIREAAADGRAHLESILFDFQQSGMAALCPRIAIKEDGVLGRFQSLEYNMAFDLGRNSLADFCVTSGIAIYRRSALEAVLRRHSLSVYAEDLENSIILLGAGDRVYYDGRLTVETGGVADWRHWFSQRVGWSYGLAKVYCEHFGDVWRTSRRRLFAGYQFLVYLGLFSLALQPFKILSLLLLAASLLNALDGFLGLNAIPPFAAVEPIYFLAVYGKYFLLSIVAFLVAVPRAERAYALPIVPLYFFYALAQVVPVSVGYANWVAVRLANRRLFQDHYQDEVSLRQSKRSTATMENA